MTSIGVTNRTGAYNRATEAHDWKRRSERLVRASGLPYTIVRPGWFDYNAPDERQLVLLQGDTRQAGDSQRWRHCAAPDRRSPGPQPRLGSRIAAGGVAGISFNSALSRLPSWMLTGKPRSSTGFSAVPTIMLHSRSSSPFRKAQNGSTDDIFSRSLGLCTSTICGPNEIICMPGCFRRSRCTPARRAWRPVRESCPASPDVPPGPCARYRCRLGLPSLGTRLACFHVKARVRLRPPILHSSISPRIPAPCLQASVVQHPAPRLGGSS
jgi:hypothetical protein